MGNKKLEIFNLIKGYTLDLCAKAMPFFYGGNVIRNTVF